MEQDVENLHRVVLAASCGNGHAQDVLLARIVHPRRKFKATSALGLDDGPSGEAAGNLCYVRLGVATVHAERVQLHQFTPVVLVQSLLFATALVGGRFHAH